MKTVFIITGEKGEGKTTTAISIIKYLKNNGITIGGFYARGYWHNNKRAQFDLIDISSGHQMVLCQTTDKHNWIKIFEYYFNPSAISSGNAILKKAAENNYQLVVIDEIGKIETQKKIWYQSVRQILEQDNYCMMWCVGKKSIDAVLQTFQPEKVTIFDISEYTPDEISEIINYQLKST